MSAVISAARSAIRSVTGTERSSFARLRAPDSLDPRYDQGGEDADTPWWRTPFLEVPATERRRGPTRDRGRDDNDDIGIDDDTDDRFYVGDDPLWPTLSHVVLMSFALRQMVRALERHHDGEKLGESCVCNMTVSQLRQCAEDAVEKAVKEVGKYELKRVGTEPKPPNPDEFPNYVHIKHVAKAPADRPKSEGALECDMQHVDFIGDDLLDVLRRRKWWDRRAKKRLKMVTAVSYWRTGKPLKVIRDELIRSEQKAAISAKKNGTPPPPTVFGTREEVQALMPKVNDKREDQKVSPEENLAGEVILLHPEEHEMRFLELMIHALLRFDVHLASTKYHVNMQIDYDEDNNIVTDSSGREYGCVDSCAIS